MAQVSKLMIFMVCLAAAASVMVASGLAAEIGQQPQTGIQEDVDSSNESFKEYSASRSEGATSFIGAVISGVDKTISAFKLIFALPSLLVNLGLPTWLATFISAPIYFSFGMFILYLITGRRTTKRI